MLLWTLIPVSVCKCSQWKAAKEELQEDDEDEAKTALALLEKKRQREIEVYR